MKKLYSGAIDIGGTNIVVGIVSNDRQVLSQDVFDTPHGQDAPIKAVKKIKELLIEQTNEIEIDIRDLEGIGIGCAGPVDSKNGYVDNPYTLPGWEGYNITKELLAETGIITKLDNDANVALLGEVVLNKLENELVVLMMFGTGIGVASFIDGKIYRAGGGYHPELGHMQIDINGSECYCGHKGCFESICSGTALNRRSIEFGYKDFDHLYDLSQDGDDKATEYLEEFKTYITAGIWNLMVVFKPSVIICGGGLMNRYFNLVETLINERIANNIGFINEFRVLKASRISNCTLVGSAELVFDDILL